MYSLFIFYLNWRSTAVPDTSWFDPKSGIVLWDATSVLLLNLQRQGSQGHAGMFHVESRDVFFFERLNDRV